MLVEKVARTICRSDWPQQEYADQQFSDELLRAIYDKYARAAIAAVFDGLAGDPGHDATEGLVPVGEDRTDAVRAWVHILAAKRKEALG